MVMVNKTSEPIKLEVKDECWYPRWPRLFKRKMKFGFLWSSYRAYWCILYDAKSDTNPTLFEVNWA